MEPQHIFTGEHLRATALGAHPHKLIVTFDVWNREKTGFSPVKTESSYVERGYTHLHLSTRRNDWFLNPDLPEALWAISGFAEAYRRRISIAFSMGCYGILLLTRVVPFRQVLMISPQMSYSSALPPFDPRFPAEIGDEPQAQEAHGSVLSGPPSEAECVILYDSKVRFDRDHAAMAGGLFENARLVDLPGGGHPATGRITAARRFRLVVDAVTGHRIREKKLVEMHHSLEA